MAQVLSESSSSQSASSGNSLIYSPLDQSRKEIRLLQIVSTNPQLKFTMHIKSLLEKPLAVFSALSYRWGGTNSTVIVNGCEIRVAQNLIDAVRDIYSHLVDTSGNQKPRLLWADAVCINQSDKTDKSQQVPLMKEIYSQAKQVLSWLGPANESVNAAFGSLGLLYKEVDTSNNDLQWIKKHQDLFAEPEHLRNLGPWQLIADLMEGDYWHRVWIFQELFLGKDTILISGKDSFPFAHMMCIYKDLSPLFKGQERPDFFGEHTWSYFRRCMSLLTIVLQPVLVAQNLVRSFETRGLNSQNNSGIPILLVLFKKAIISLGATDPRDYVYAFAGVANLPLQLDYQSPVHLVYIDFIEWWRAFIALAEQKGSQRLINTMWFLRFARVINPGSDGRPTPSWLPRPVWGSDEQPLLDRSHNIRNAVFCNDDAPSWEIHGIYLHCTAVKIDSVCNLGITALGSIGKILDSQRLIDEFWAIGDFKSTDLPRMTDFLPQLLQLTFDNEELMQEQALYSSWDFLYQILFRDSTEGTLQDKERVLDAISCLISNVWPDFEFELILNGNAWADPDGHDTGARTLSECILGEGFHEWSRSANVDVQGLEDFLDKVSSRWDRKTKQEREQLTSMVADSLRVGEMNGRVTRTAKGYAAILPPRTNKADEIWLLKDYENPVVLRPEGDYYILIGNCLVPNCLERRSKDSVQELQSAADEIKIG